MKNTFHLLENTNFFSLLPTIHAQENGEINENVATQNNNLLTVIDDIVFSSSLGNKKQQQYPLLEKKENKIIDRSMPYSLINNGMNQGDSDLIISTPIVTESGGLTSINGNRSVLIHLLEPYLGKNCTVDEVERDCGGLEMLVCLNGICSLCTNNTQCNEQIHSLFTCQENFTTIIDGQMVTGGVCDHKHLFDYVSYLDILATITCFLGGVLSSASGTGGGGLFVPLLHVAGQFGTNLAVPISNVIIFGAGVVNFATLVFKRHPHADRPLIDYDIALMMEPSTLLGTIIGVFFNIMFPDWLILGLVMFILTLTTFVMFKNGMKRAVKEFACLKGFSYSKLFCFCFRKKGNKEENYSINVNHKDDETSEEPVATETHNNEEDDDEEYKSLISNTSSNNNKEQVNYSTLNNNNNEEDLERGNNTEVDVATEDIKEMTPDEKLLQSIYKSERRTPWLKVIVLVLCWGIIFTLNLLKGGEGAPSAIGIKRCSDLYWVLISLNFPLLGFMTILIALYMMWSYRRKQRLNYKFVEGDVHWNWKTVCMYPFACISVGCVSSLLGIGGGMLKSPLLLMLGTDPVASSATTSFMILFTSSMSVAQYIINGILPLDYGLWFAGTGALSGIFGFIFQKFVLERWSEKKSPMIFCIAVVTAIATVLMGVAGSYDVYEDVRRGIYMGFKNPCL
ncbi:hypothetical protein ABK040_004523 [Willaertia magna]